MKALIVLVVALLATGGFLLHYSYTHTHTKPRYFTPANTVTPIPTGGDYWVRLRDNVVYDSGHIKHV